MLEVGTVVGNTAAQGQQLNIMNANEEVGCTLHSPVSVLAAFSMADYPPTVCSSQNDILRSVSELKVYHQKCLKVIEQIENEGMESVREKVENSELVIPNKLKIDLNHLVIQPVKSGLITPGKLHTSLKKRLVFNPSLVELSLPNKRDPNSMFNFLSSCNTTLMKMQAKHFYTYVAFGYYLEIYYLEVYKKNKTGQSWGKFIKANFGISDGYGRKLRDIGAFVQKYPRMKYLSIHVEEFRRLMKHISQMMLVEEYRQYWSCRGEDLELNTSCAGKSGVHTDGQSAAAVGESAPAGTLSLSTHTSTTEGSLQWDSTDLSFSKSNSTDNDADMKEY